MDSSARAAKNQLRATRNFAWQVIAYAGIGIMVLLVAGMLVYLLASPTVGLLVLTIAGSLTLTVIGFWWGYVDPASEAVRCYSSLLQKKFRPAKKKFGFRSISPLHNTPPPRIFLA